MTWTIPEEEIYTEAELSFIENSPPNLWPDDQRSNFGQVRRVVTDESQALRDLLITLWLNMSPSTAELYLGNWEEEVGIPPSPDIELALRRANVLSRFKRGAFTRGKRSQIIENFLHAVFGTPARFTPEGIPFTAAGIPLFGEFTSEKDLYRVYEYVKNFSYQVRISNLYDVDMVGLERELKRITPAGISFGINHDKAVPVDYVNMIRDLDPNAYWPMNETSGTEMVDWIKGFSNGVYVGGPTLDHRQLDLSNAYKAPLFDGGNDRATIVATPWLDVGDVFTIVAWVYPTDIIAKRAIYTRGYDEMGFTIEDERLFLARNAETTLAQTDQILTQDEIQVVGASRNGNVAPRMWRNGVQVFSNYTPDTFAGDVGNAMIGAYDTGLLWNFSGNIGHVALFNRELSEVEWQRIWDVGRDILD